MAVRDNIGQQINTEVYFSQLASADSTLSNEQVVNGGADLDVRQFSHIKGQFRATTGVGGYYPQSYGGTIIAFKEDSSSLYIYISSTNPIEDFDIDITEFTRLKFAANCKSDGYRGYVSFSNVTLS